MKPRVAPAVDRVLVVPCWIIDRTAQLLQPYAAQEVECPALWYGIENDATGIDVVTTTALPDAERHPASYNIPEKEMTRLNQAAIRQGIVLLAQVHTHPTGYGTRHSPTDDQRAAGLGEGLLSLVYPDYGADPGFDLGKIGVHERGDGRWTRLSPLQGSRRIRILPNELVQGSTRD